MDLGKLSELSMRRKCLECGAVFVTNEEGTALAKYSDHSVIHQPTGAQWTEAYNKIQAGKERAKKHSSDPT